MSQVTALWVLTQVDDLVPNGCSDEQKRHWLHQAECFAALDCRYVEAQIHYANGEMSRYNNAMAAWNELFLAWRDWLGRGGGEKTSAAALKLC